MFDDIQHIGYCVRDIDAAVAWFAKAFGAANAGGSTMQPSPMFSQGGRNAFVRFGEVEVELMQPGADAAALPADTLVPHHVGWVVSDIAKAAAAARAKGVRFLADAPYTNPMGQRVLYFDPATTNGAWMHLTEVPPKPPAVRGPAPVITGIVHPGYLVSDVDRAAAWWVETLGGVRIGGGPSRRGGRIAFVNVGRAQVELIESESRAGIGPGHVLDHVGYRVENLAADLAGWRAQGFRFQTEAPAVNPVGQTLIYFDTATSMGSRMHLTELPA